MTDLLKAILSVKGARKVPELAKIGRARTNQLASRRNLTTSRKSGADKWRVQVRDALAAALLNPALPEACRPLIAEWITQHRGK